MPRNNKLRHKFWFGPRRRKAATISPKELKIGGAEGPERITNLNQLKELISIVSSFILPAACRGLITFTGHEAETCPEVSHAWHLIGQQQARLP